MRCKGVDVVKSLCNDTNWEHCGFTLTLKSYWLFIGIIVEVLILATHYFQFLYSGHSRTGFLTCLIMIIHPSQLLIYLQKTL
jgi:hypothetical protein